MKKCLLIDTKNIVGAMEGTAAVVGTVPKAAECGIP
jgi:hypothetical protein